MGLASNIGNSLSNITNIVNQYVVAPAAAFGLAGFVFNAEGEATANLSADITDHYTEDNTAIQDHIAIHPKRITLKGYVGELVYNTPGDGPTTLNTLTQKLTSLSSFLPAITASATQAQALLTGSSAPTVPGILGTASNIYGLVQNILGAFGNTANQQNAYTYFKALMQSGTLMGIQTPWEFMTNMAIETIVATQPETSQWITDFSITLKELRIAQTSTTSTGSSTNASSTAGAAASNGAFGSNIGPMNATVQAGDAAVQSAAVTNLGPIPGATTNVTTTNLSSNQQYGPTLQ